jgi:hypothetical protein
MRAIRGTALLLASVAAVRSAQATSPAALPPLVERLAQWPEQRAAGWDLPRDFPVVVETWGYDAQGRPGEAPERRRLAAEESALLEALVVAQRENDRAPFARALDHGSPWLRDQALAALPHGRVATGFGTAYVPMHAARGEDVRFVLSFLPALRRLAVTVPPASGGFEHEATPVLATKVLLLLAPHVEAVERESVLDAAVAGLVAIPHWRALDELRDLLEERPSVVLSAAARARLLPVLRGVLDVEPQAYRATAILGRLRDAEGLDAVFARWQETRKGTDLLALAHGGHPRALEAVRVALRAPARPAEATTASYGPPAPSVPRPTHDLRAAALLADPVLVPDVVRRIQGDGEAVWVGIDALERMRARDALGDVLREAWAHAGREHVVHRAAGALLRLDPGLAAGLRERAAAAPRPLLRLAVAQALAESGLDASALGVDASLAFHDPGHSVGPFSLLLARVRHGDEAAAATLVGHLSGMQEEARRDARRHAPLVHAMQRLTSLERLPASLEAWLGEARPPFALDVLARAGDPARAMALLAPLTTYANAEHARASARVSYAIAERRAASPR